MCVKFYPDEMIDAFVRMSKSTRSHLSCPTAIRVRRMCWRIACVSCAFDLDSVSTLLCVRVYAIVYLWAGCILPNGTGAERPAQRSWIEGLTKPRGREKKKRLQQCGVLEHEGAGVKAADWWRWR